MNERPSPYVILDRYNTATLPKLSEEELTIVQQHLASSGMKAIFGVLPLQANAPFTDAGFVTRELSGARDRLQTSEQQLIAGPYVADGQYYPAGVILYHAEQ
jgi:hypothetical protein